jgi:hypothetical protein
MSPKTPLSFRKSGCGRQLGEKAEDFLRQSIALNFGRSAATATESSHRNAQLVNRSNLIDHEIDVSREGEGRSVTGYVRCRMMLLSRYLPAG